jgi:hypothetical protein
VTVQRFREQPRTGCFANATCAGKQIRVVQPLMLDSIAKGSRDRLLACYFVKRLWAPFARDYLIGHVERSFSPRLIQLLRTSSGVEYLFSRFQSISGVPSESTSTTRKATNTSDRS